MYFDTDSIASDTASRAHFKKLIFVTSVGSILEFYDFSSVAIFATSLTVTFLPEGSRGNELWVFAIFSLGFMIRTFGGLLFSHFGDRSGRKVAFQASILLISISTLSIGLLPGYTSIGGFALVALILLRVIQGVSVSGELPGALIFAVESISKKYHGLIAAVIICAGSVGSMLAALMGYLIHSILTVEQANSWGWRIAFIFGSGIGFIGYIARRDLNEPPIFNTMVQAGERKRVPLITLFKHYKSKVISAIGFTALSTTFYPLYLMLPSFSNRYYDTPAVMGYQNTALVIGFYCCLSIIFGAVSDRFNRLYLIITAALLVMAAVPVMAWLLLHQHLLIALVLISIPVALANGSFAPLVIDMFDPAIRYTGIAFSMNLGITLFVITTPMTVEWLAQRQILLALQGYLWVNQG